MAQTYFCLCCGSENPVKNIKCSCGASINEIDIVIPKTVSRAAQLDILSIPLGERIDFSIFESIAADLEKEVGNLGDEKDLGKWGGKAMDGKDLIEQIRQSSSSK